MDTALVLFAILLLLVALFNSSVRFFISYLKQKNKEPIDNKNNCIHTEIDCENCMSALHCNVKSQNLVQPKSAEEMAQKSAEQSTQDSAQHSSNK